MLQQKILHNIILKTKQTKDLQEFKKWNIFRKRKTKIKRIHFLIRKIDPLLYLAYNLLPSTLKSMSNIYAHTF